MTGAGPAGTGAGRPVKCVVWDLDHTLWDGVLLEDPRVRLRPGVAAVIRTLDSRGILHSIASRNDHDAAVAALDRFGLLDYFLYPQITWEAKSESIRAIGQTLNLGLDSLAFVDDDPVERAEVQFSLPAVRCLDAGDAAGLADRPELSPRLVTDEARLRRRMYQAARVREDDAARFGGPPEAFLATLGMRLQITAARPEDLARAEELTLRTNQLNTTGRTYSRAELDALRRSNDHDLLVARLADRYGPYGTIGLALVGRAPGTWVIKLLLVSCRVISRGIGAALLNHLRRAAHGAGVRLQADFVPSGRNRMMRITYTFAGFREVGRRGELVRLEADRGEPPPFPDYLQVNVD